MFFNLDYQANKDKLSLLAFELTPRNNEAAVPVDDFEMVLTDKPYEEMTDAELLALPSGSTMLLDTEFYENYSLIAFKSFVNGKIVSFERWEEIERDKSWNLLKLQWMMETFTTVGYNSRDYDIPMIRVALQGFGSKSLKSCSNWIIFDMVRPYEVEKKYNLVSVSWNHVDLIEVAPLRGSLKLYAGRLHCRRMQDLPYPHDAVLTDEECAKLKRYCVNDLDNTELLMNELAPQLSLRASLSSVYGIDLRSRSDAQIAEYVIASELTKLNGKKPERPEIPPGKKYYYAPPKWVCYKSQTLNYMLNVVKNSVFVVESDGSIGLPKEISNLQIKIGNATYRMGIGGLHSSEKSIAHIAGETHLIIDRDVASYYPSIIINNELIPKHLGQAFLAVYKSLVDRRLYAKHIGDAVTADSLKITINGCFGKLGNRWSVLYSPDLLIQVTITGQLALLMLIDTLESKGIEVISANTDGLLIKPLKEQLETVGAVIKQWELETGFVTEENQYSAIYSRDVNNYIAIPKDPKKKPKVKGAYSEKGSAGNSSLSRNPECFVCIDAVIAYLTNNVAVEETINACKDIRRFVTVRNVKGGAAKSGLYVGKTIRWYYSTNIKGQISYRTTGNKVPNSDGAMPLMEMPASLPVDIDYIRYIAIAKEMLMDIGVKQRPAKISRSKNTHQFEFSL